MKVFISGSKHINELDEKSKENKGYIDNSNESAICKRIHQTNNSLFTRV